jgi:hypothetical protein
LVFFLGVLFGVFFLGLTSYGQPDILPTKPTRGNLMKKKLFMVAVLMVLVGVTWVWGATMDTEIYYKKKTSIAGPVKKLFRFSLWDAETSGNMIWSEEKEVKVKASGDIVTLLGDMVPLNPADFSQQLWVQVDKVKSGPIYTEVGLRDKFGVVPFALSAGNLDIAQGSHIGAATKDTFTYDGDPMGWYSIGWKDDSWFGFGNTAWLSGYGGIKLFTGGGQPAVAIGFWGDTTLGNNLTVNGNISKTGTVSFVERHPADTSKAIVYVSLEGGEAGTYCRGTAVLRNGTAIIELPEHFTFVTSNEGLTVQVTPNGPCNGLYVASRTNTFIVVNELGNGTSNVSFDWIVHGIRKGYESYDPISSDPALLEALDEVDK